jgi:hypothetical protein
VQSDHIDNNLALKYLENEAKNLNWIVTRPPAFVTRLSIEWQCWPMMISSKHPSIVVNMAFGLSLIIGGLFYLGLT